MPATCIKGKPVDDQTRCVHYHSPRDVIAIKFKCCGEYYPCFECHKETAGHPANTWNKNEHNTTAIFCGVCKIEMSIADYLASNNQCPNCSAAFNPGCALHYPLYFEL